MTGDYDKGSFRLDPEAQPFRMTGLRWRDLPAFLLGLILVICLVTGYNIMGALGLSFLSPAIQRVAWGLVLGLCFGYLAGVSVGARRGETDVLQLPPLSDGVKQLAREPDGLIPAIKACREETGAGLKEAKTAVEAYINQQGSH